MKDAARLKTIVATFAKHGFQNLVERAKLGRFLVEKILSAPLDETTAPERLRRCFEELGPAFVKLGQVLASRPDLVPATYSDEFKKLQDQVPPAPFPDIESVLASHFDCDIKDIFADFETTPVGAASIAQVYRASLMDGSRVVVKVQRPGIDTIIAEDLSILFRLAELMDKYVPETRSYNPVGIVEEFARHLELETNFVVEANNIRRFSENFAAESDIVIPKVHSQFVGKRVLVMEELVGIPLSHKNALDQQGIDPEVVLRKGLRAYLKMVFRDGLFHGDLHAGNIFVLPDQRIGLIDFGAVGRLNASTQKVIAVLLVALSEEDYERLAYTYVDLAPFNEHVDVDAFARDLRDLIAPYFGLSMKHMNVGRLLMSSTAVAGSHGLILPSELILFFKSIVTIEGMAQILMRDFDFLSVSMEFAREIVLAKQDPKRWLTDASHMSRDMASLILPLPRQLRQLLRRWNHPTAALRIEWTAQDEFLRTYERGISHLVRGFIAAALILAGAILALVPAATSFFLGLPLVSVLAFAAAIVMFLL